MTAVVRACAEEARRVFRDPGALLVLGGAMVLYSFFYPLPYVPQVLRDVPVAVVDLDGSALSRQLVRMVDEHELVRVTARPADLVEAEHLARDGEVGGVLAIPAGFERAIRRGEQARVSGFGDAGSFLVYRQVLTGLLEATGTFSAGIEVRRLQGQGMPLDRALAARDPVPLVTRPLFNPLEGYLTYVVPAVLVLILQQTLLVGIGLVGGTAAERGGRGVGGGGGSDGAPASGWRTAIGALATLVGRALFYVALYLVHALFCFGVVYRLHGLPQMAEPAELFLFTLPFLIAVVLLGLTIRPVFKARETSIQVLVFTSLPAIFLAAFAWPTEAIPSWLNAVARWLPSTTAIPGFLRLTGMGATLADVGVEWNWLWTLCGIYLATAWIAGWREVSRQKL